MDVEYCTNCGDPLVRLNRIKVNQVFAIIVSIVFIAPLLAVAFGLFWLIDRWFWLFGRCFWLMGCCFVLMGRCFWLMVNG